MAMRQGATHTWFASSYSAAKECVEVRSPVTHSVAVRDSKATDGLTLSVHSEAWDGFVDAVRNGRLGG